MSFHKSPKYQIPALIEALKQHGLEHDAPSQLSDAFRTGYVAALAAAPAQPDLPKQESLGEPFDKVLHDNLWSLYTAEPAQPDTHAQELTAYEITVGNLRLENSALRGALLQGAREVEALKRECGIEAESPQAIRNGMYMDIGYRMRAALAGTAPAPSKEYAELPEHVQTGGGPDFTHYFSAHQMRDFADATHALRTGEKT